MDIGAILGGVGDLIGAFTNIGTSAANLKHQKEQFEYQKELNAQYLDRMDNRLGYMVKDAKNAGINPLAAIGQSGGYQSLSSAPAPQSANVGDFIHNATSNAFQNAKIMSDILTASSQINNIEADTELKKVNSIQSLANTDLIKTSTKKELANIIGVNLDNIAKEMENKYLDRYGSKSIGGTTLTNSISYGSNALGNAVNSLGNIISNSVNKIKNNYMNGGKK